MDTFLNEHLVIFDVKSKIEYVYYIRHVRHCFYVLWPFPARNGSKLRITT